MWCSYPNWVQGATEQEQFIDEYSHHVENELRDVLSAILWLLPE